MWRAQGDLQLALYSILDVFYRHIAVAEYVICARIIEERPDQIRRLGFNDDCFVVNKNGEIFCMKC